MLLECDRSACTTSISREASIDSILTCFNPADTATEDEKEQMTDRPYRELVGALAWLRLTLEGTR